MKTQTANWCLITWLVLAPLSSAAAEPSGEYAVDLATVYGGYQRMLALKEACDKGASTTRATNDKAFAAWAGRHRALLQELQRRVTAMIRLASTDDKDYARNLGKYEGAILQERQDYRDTLLGLGADELREQCQRMPESLNGPEADLNKVYAGELAVIRKRK